MHRSRVLAAASLALLLLGTTYAEASTDGPAPRSGWSQTGPRLLERTLGGRAALKALGDRLDEAAAVNRLSPALLRKVLTTDETAHVTPTGQIFYEEVPAPATTGSVPVARSAALSENATFQLHSDPTSQHTIYLNFKGKVLQNTIWNDASANPGRALPPGFHPGFTIDSDASTFNAEELTQIHDMWAMIAETYAAYDVDVTTEDQGAGAYNRSTPTDPTYGTEVLFTSDSAASSVCHIPCSGVAPLGQFDTDDQYDGRTGYFEPVLVFSSRNGTPQAVTNTQVAVHEIGHTLGLIHDGVTTVSNDNYFAGHGDWAPIMGAGFLNPIQQFSKGEYADANNTQDDLTVIAQHGAPRRFDDTGGTQARATTLGSRTSYTVKGLIGTRTDVDVYEVNHACASTLTATATPTGPRSALDIKLQLYKGSTVVDSDDPPSKQTFDTSTSPATRIASGLGASVSRTSAAKGTYYLRVDGVGKGNPKVDGYSDYASIGTYTLKISGCASATKAPLGAPRSLKATFAKSIGTVSWKAPATTAGITGYRINGFPGGPIEVAKSVTSRKITGLIGGARLRIGVQTLNVAGGGTAATLVKRVPTWAPTSPPNLKITISGTRATASWTPAPNPGGALGTDWKLTGPVGVSPRSYTFPWEIRGGFPWFLANGTHTATLKPIMIADSGTAPSRTVTFVLGGPSAPGTSTATSGTKGKPVTATVRWKAPSKSGAAGISGYRVYASKVVKGKVTKVTTSSKRAASARSYVFTLPAGTYKFRVVALNKYGASPYSGYSKVVTAR